MEIIALLTGLVGLIYAVFKYYTSKTSKTKRAMDLYREQKQYLEERYGEIIRKETGKIQSRTDDLINDLDAVLRENRKNRPRE